MQEILEMIKSSDLSAAKDAASEFVELELSLSDNVVSCESLLNIYEMRAKHLEQYSSEHALQLKISTQELCNNLRKYIDDSCILHHLEGQLSHQYILIVLSNRNTLIGCLKIVSELNVSASEWTKLWIPSHNQKSLSTADGDDKP